VKEIEHAYRKRYIKFWEGKWVEGTEDREYVYNLKTIQQISVWCVKFLQHFCNITIRKWLKCEYA